VNRERDVVRNRLPRSLRLFSAFLRDLCVRSRPYATDAR
jgi:hypothetical protein